jgi:GDP-L-fucose synthase
MDLTAMDKKEKIFVAGHNGLVGSAITRALEKEGYKNIILAGRTILNLENQKTVNDFFCKTTPEYVFLAAAKVGGIHANNTLRADFIYNNLIIQTNVIHAAWKYKVKRLLFLGSSCIYPRDCPQPIHENYLLSGSLETTNEPYAIAKIAGVKLCEAYHQQYGCQFLSVMPTNLYGPNDNFELETAHVLPSLLRKFHEAKIKKANYVTIWGDGTPKREFLYVDDLANACLQLISLDKFISPINIGSNQEVSIRELALLIKKIVGFNGKLHFDLSKPNGTARKLLDGTLLKTLGWTPTVSLEEGIIKTYRYLLKQSKQK